MLRSHRLALASAAVVIGLTLAACGDDPGATVNAGAPPVVHIGSGGPANGQGTAGEAMADSSRLAMPYGYVTYVFDGQLPVLDSTGTGWMFPAGAQPDLDRVARIAAALGVEGDVHAVPADQGGGWMAGPADYSGSTLWVGSDGMLSWWYNPSPNDSVKGSGCAYAEGDSGAAGTSAETSSSEGEPTVAPEDTIAVDTVLVDPIPVCEEPEPPAGVLGETEAIAAARSLFADLGYDTGDYEFEAYADEWGANVTASLLVDGQRAPISLSAGFGENGAVTWAGGVLADPIAVGEYPLVDAGAGLERLNDESGQWMYYGMGSMMDVARDTAVAAETGVGESDASASEANASADTTAGVTEPPADPAVDMPMPCEPAAGCEMPEPEPIEVHFSTVRLGLTFVYDVDGTVWLLPAFVFSNANGEEYSVIAVDDAYLDVPQLPVPEPGDTVPVETIVPGDTAPPVDTVLPEQVELDAAAELLVGLPVDEAAKVAEEQGWEFRVVREDGEDLIVTADYRPLRLNVAVEAGVVTEVVSVG